MKKLTTTLAIAMLLVSSAFATPEVWKVETSEMFGSSDQLEELQKLVAENPEAEFIGIGWMNRDVVNVLVWDQKANMLFRIKKDPVGARWESWNATAQLIASDDPSDGFDLPNYSTGHGRPDLTQEAVKFLLNH